MKLITYLFIIIILYCLSLGFFPYFKIMHAVPDLLLVYSVILSLESDGKAYIFGPLLAGVMLDFASGLPIGSFSLGFVLVSMLIREVDKQMMVIQRNWKYLSAVVVLSQIGLHLWVYIYAAFSVRLGFGHVHVDFGEQLSLFLGRGIYNLLIFYPVWVLADFQAKINQRFFSRLGK